MDFFDKMKDGISKGIDTIMPRARAGRETGPAVDSACAVTEGPSKSWRVGFRAVPEGAR
jgi:hypothetical protein